LISPDNDFSVDYGNGDVFATRGNGAIARLNRATGKWVDIVGGGVQNYSTADGMGGTSIAITVPRVVGASGANPVVLLSVGSSNTMIKWYDSTLTYRQSHLLGTVSADSLSFCADGTAGSACTAVSPLNTTHLSWDSNTSQWMFAKNGTTAVRTMAVGGTMGTWGTVSNPIKNFVYVPSTDTVYYCNNTTLKIHKYTGGTDTALTWPIPAMQCAGKSMVFDSGKLFFIYNLNQITGVAEYTVP
jgi:hypothetical protein